MEKLTLVYDYIFPTFALPNALNPQFGIINYILSQYNDKVQYSTFLENDPTQFQKMFDNSFGYSQNTLTGFILEADVYRGKIDNEYESLYLASKKGKKFIYPVKPSPTLLNFCGINNQGNDGNKVAGDYFWKFISKKALAEIQNNRGVILIDYSMEPFISLDYHKLLHTCLKESGISPKSIYIAVNSFNAKQLYENWFSAEDRMYNIINTPFCLEHSSYYYSQSLDRNENKVITLNKFLSTKDVVRDNYFLMKIKAPKEHRLKTLILLTDDSLINLGDWSFSGEQNFSKTEGYKNAIRNLNLKNRAQVEELLDRGQHNLKSEENCLFNDINAWTDEDYAPHLSSYFDICFESFFYIESEAISLTEKIFKPIINFQPFIYVATKGSLQVLRDLGFKTFEPFIDESYDQELDNDKRLFMAYEQIKRLCLMSKQEIHEWYWGMQDILIHNHQHLLNIHKNKMITETALEELYESLK
jgi:hypothetical protein